MKATITGRGRVTIPAELRREMHLTPGRVVMWERVCATECRVIVEPTRKAKPNPVAALNFAKEHGLETMPTDQWMRILREGEED